MHPLLVGGNPFTTTSIYGLILFLEKKWGIHYSMGGTGNIVKGLEKLMLEENIKILKGSEVTKINLENGKIRSVKLKNQKDTKVYCFIGEMTAETGIAHECIKYSRNFKLPIHFIVEDNEKSVCTDTRNAWNQKKLTYENISDEYVTYYHYTSKYPHAGAGKRIQF